MESNVEVLRVICQSDGMESNQLQYIEKKSCKLKLMELVKH